MNAHPNPARAASPWAGSPAYPRTRLPSRMLEYGYYLSLFYSVMSPALGLSVGMLGAAFVAVLAGFCLARLGTKVRVIYAPLVYPVGCSVCYLLIQIVLYKESISGNENRSFVTWILALVVIQSLALRPGFLHRFAIALLLVGICMLPFLQVSSPSNEAERFSLDRSVGFANPNDLGAYFGFCCLYFIIAGFEARQILFRATSWLAAIVCLYVVGLTVSRAPLFAVALAATVGARRLLKRGFVPILALVLVAWLLYLGGLFDRSVASYQSRLTEETGRLRVWPLAVERFWDSPWFGFGMAHVETYVGTTGYTPHNGFLYVGLSSGVVPLLFFVAYWWRSGTEALSRARQSSRDAPFYVPLWVYAFLINFQLNNGFLAPWSIAILGVSMSAGWDVRGQSAVQRRQRQPAVPLAIHRPRIP